MNTTLDLRRFLLALALIALAYLMMMDRSLPAQTFTPTASTLHAKHS